MGGLPVAPEKRRWTVATGVGTMPPSPWMLRRFSMCTLDDYLNGTELGTDHIGFSWIIMGSYGIYIYIMGYMYIYILCIYIYIYISDHHKGTVVTPDQMSVTPKGMAVRCGNSAGALHSVLCRNFLRNLLESWNRNSSPNVNKGFIPF